MNTLNLNKLKQLLDIPDLKFEQRIQHLWSGYGQIIRLTSPATNKSFVVKVVAPESRTEHPRGWHSDIGHQRKLTSYQVESYFYQHYGTQTDEHCQVPALIACDIHDQMTLLVMEDLDASGFFVRKTEACWQSLSLAIRWLAFFHIKFLGCRGQGLWQTGCYWHLATRQEEWQNMPESHLKQQAQLIDQTLTSAQFQTLVHGDAKFANLCFHHSGEKVAAVDFQYVGLGSGVKDLAYLAGSCLDNDGLFYYHEKIIESYLVYTKQAIEHYKHTIDYHAFSSETRYLYAFAWADFYRFLLGWNPQSWKVCDYIKVQSDKALKELHSSLN